MHRLGALLAALSLVGGCSTSEVRLAHSVELVPATESIPEEQLLDVNVVQFDPGVPEGEVEKDVAEEFEDPILKILYIFAITCVCLV